MKVVVKIVWFSATIAAGLMAGLWIRPKEVKTSSTRTFAAQTKTPSLKFNNSSGHNTKSYQKITIEEMDDEVTKAESTDLKFALTAFFFGNRTRFAKAEQACRRLSNGKYNYFVKQQSEYRNASTEEEKRHAYRELTHQRLLGLLYLYELSRQEDLLVQPPADQGNRATKSSLDYK